MLRRISYRWNTLEKKPLITPHGWSKKGHVVLNLSCTGVWILKFKEGKVELFVFSYKALVVNLAHLGLAQGRPHHTCTPRASLLNY